MLHLPYRVESKDKKHKATEAHVDEIDYRIHRQHSTISKRTNSEFTSSSDDYDSNDSIDSFNMSHHGEVDNSEKVHDLPDEDECSCCIDKYFDVPPPLIVCLVRHMNKERKPITTPSSIGKCVRDLQSYFTPSIAASSIQPLNESNLVSQHKDNNNTFEENIGNKVYNTESMRDEHKKLEPQVKLEFGKSLDVFEPLSSLKSERKTNRVIESNVQINNKNNSTTHNHTNIVKSAGNQTNHTTTTTTSSNSGSNNEAGNNVKSMHTKEEYLEEEEEEEELSEDNDVANNVLLYICLYAIDEDTSSPAILRQMASDWRKTLQLNGKQEDVLFMLYHKDIAYEAEKEREDRGRDIAATNKMEKEKELMNESAKSKTKQEEKKLENELKQSSNSDKKFISNNNNNNDKSANNRIGQDAQNSNCKGDSSHLETATRSETTKTTISNRPNVKLSKWGLHTMVDYMTASSTVTPMSTRAHSSSNSNSESPVHSRFASLTSSPSSGIATRTKNTSVRTRAIEPYFAELQALHFTSAQMCVYTSQDAHLNVINAIWHAQQRRVDKLTSDMEKYAAQQRRLPLAPHEKLNNEYLHEYMKRSAENGNDDDIDNNASNINREADLHSTRKETQKPTEQVEKEYWSIQHYWRLGYRLAVQYLQFGQLQQCQLTFDKMLHMYYNNSDDFALMTQPNTMHKLSKKGERLFTIHRHSSEHVLHHTIDLLRRLVWVVACEMHCALMLHDLESAQNTLRLFMQILKERFDEENKLMSHIVVQLTNSTTHKKTDFRFRKMTRRNDQHLFQLQCYLSALHLFFKFVIIEEPLSIQSSKTQEVDEDNDKFTNENDIESEKTKKEEEEEYIIEDILESYMQTVNLCTSEQENSKTDILMELIHHLHDRITLFMTVNTNNKKGHKSTKRIVDGRYNSGSNSNSNNNKKKLSEAELEMIASLCLSARDVTESIAVELEKLDKGNDNEEILHLREQGLLTSQNALKEEWQWLILAAACCYRQLNKVKYNKLEFTLWLSLCVSYTSTHTRLAKNIAVYLLQSLHAYDVTLQNKSVFQWHAIMQLLQEIWIDCVWREINHNSNSSSVNNIIMTSKASGQDEQMQTMRDVMINTFASLKMYRMYVSSLIDLIKDYAYAKQMRHIKLGQFALYTYAHELSKNDDDSNANDVTYKYWQRWLHIDPLVKEFGLFNEENQEPTRHDLSQIATDFSFNVHLINSATSTQHNNHSASNNNNLQLTDTAIKKENEITPVAHYKINDSVYIVLSMNCFIDLFNNSHEPLTQQETQTTIAPARVKLTMESRQDWADDNEPVHVVTLQNYTVTTQMTNYQKMNNINNDRSIATNVYHIELTFPFNICHAGQYCVKSIQIIVNSTELFYEYHEQDGENYNNDYKNCRGLNENCNKQEYVKTLFHVEEHVEEELIISMAKSGNNRKIKDVDVRKNKTSELHNEYKQLEKEEQSVGMKSVNTDKHYFADMPSSFVLRIDGVQIQENIKNSTDEQSIDSLEKNINIKNDNASNVADSSEQKCHFKVSEVLAEEEEMEKEESEESEIEEEESESQQQTSEHVKSIDKSRPNKLILFPTCKFSFLQNKSCLSDSKLYKQQSEHMEKVAQSCNNNGNAEANSTNDNNNNHHHELVKKTKEENKTCLDHVSPFNSFSSFASASFWQPSALQPNASLFGVMQVKLSPPHISNVHSSSSQEQKHVQSQAAQICVTAKGQTYLLNKSFALQSTPKSYNVNCKTNNDINDVNTNKNVIDLSYNKQQTSPSALLHPLSASPAMESPSTMLLSPSSDRKSFVNNTSICSELCKNDAIMHVCLFHKSQEHKDNMSFTSIPCVLSELISPHAAQTSSLLENAKVEWTCESKEAELPELSIHAVPLHSISSLLRHGLHFRLVKESNESTTDKVVVNDDGEYVKTNTEELQNEKVKPTSCSLLVSLPLLPFLLRSETNHQHPTNNITSIAEENKHDIDYTQQVKLSFFQINGDQLRSCVLRSPLFVCEPAFDVRYTFRHLHQRVYCIVSMRTMLTQTSLHFRGALLHVHRVCSDDRNEEHNHCNMMCSNIFHKSMTNTNDSDYEVIRVSPIYNHLLECEWKPQMEVQLLFELALKDLSSTSLTNIITNNNINKSANRMHSVQVQIFYSPWQMHNTKEEEIIEQDWKIKNTVLRYHQKEMYERSDIDETTTSFAANAAVVTHDVFEKNISESETESDDDSSLDASSNSELTSQALCFNKQIAIELYQHCNSYWGHCASFDALRNVLFSVHINIVNLNANGRMTDIESKITEKNTGDNRDIDLAKEEDSYNNAYSASKQLELMRFADKIRIGQVVHFAITFVINPANWPEHAAEREEFVVELVVNKLQWNIVGKQRVRRVISLMEGSVVIPFDAIPLPAWRSHSSIDGSESSKTNSSKKYDNENNNAEQKKNTLNNNNTISSSSSISSSNSNSSNSSETENATERQNNKKLVANNFSASNIEQSEMSRANMITAASNKESLHTVATPTVRVFWINRHVVCEDDDNRLQSNDRSHVDNCSSAIKVDEGIVGELVNLDIVQFRPTMNVIA